MSRRTRNVTARLRVAAGVVGVAALVAPLAACSSGGDHDRTHITVASFSGLDASAQAAFDGLVEEFEDANPDVDVSLQVYGFSAQSYSADLAAGRVPTVFLAPFADAPALVRSDQVAHIEPELTDYPYLDGKGSDDLDHALTAPGTTDKQLRGIPATASPARLYYDRDAFERAGLDADKPPTTWAQLRSDARTLTQKTGEVGLGLPTLDGAGGATLAAIVDATGGRIEKGDAVHLAGAATAFETLHHMRWDDGSLGTTQLHGTDDVLRAFAAQKVAMFIATDDPSTLAVRYGVQEDSLGIAPIPLSGASAGVAVDGMTAFVSPRATAAQQDAGVRWINTAYAAGLINGDDSSISDVSGTVASRALAAAEATGGPGASDGVPSAASTPVPTSPSSAGPATSLSRPEVNPDDDPDADGDGGQDADPVGPLAGLTPVNILAISSVPGRPLVAPPVVAPRAEYAALDTVLLAVLTHRDADVSALLASAQREVEGAVSQG